MADNQKVFNCAICLHALKDPVTTACGHSYCMNCINSFWDQHANQQVYSCPQCRQTFTHRPVLKRNTLLTELLDKHKGHDTVSAAAEKSEKQRQLEKTKQEIVHRALNSERSMEELRQAADSVRAAAWETVDDFERVCMEHIRSYVWSVERKCSEMREKVGETEKAAVDRTNGLMGQLKRDASELRRSEAKLNQLYLMEDPIQFLQSSRALGDLPVSTASPRSLEMVMQFVTAQKSKLEKICKEEKDEILSALEKNMLSKIPTTWVDTLSRPYLLAQYHKLEMDPNTVAACLYLSDRNREISWSDRDQTHPNHPDRFTFYHQALCKDGLTNQHYWEVEWDGGIVDVAVSYKGIHRKGSGNDCCFGHNNLSWSLACSPTGCTFWHNNIHKAQIPQACSRRVGLFLDHCAGILCFYSVSDSGRLTCLHRVQTRFTEPLYPGFCVDLGSTLTICKLQTNAQY